MLKMHVDCVEGFAQMTEGTHLALFFPPSAQEVCEFLSPNFTKDAWETPIATVLHSHQLHDLFASNGRTWLPPRQDTNVPIHKGNESHVLLMTCQSNICNVFPLNRQDVAVTYNNDIPTDTLTKKTSLILEDNWGLLLSFFSLCFYLYLFKLFIYFAYCGCMRRTKCIFFSGTWFERHNLGAILSWSFAPLIK